jgi:cysteinyl-tRNA synthetase
MADSVLTTGGQELFAQVNPIMEVAAPTDEGLQRAWAAICARKPKNGSKRKAADGAVRGGRDSHRQRVAAEDGHKGIIESDAAMEGHAVNDTTMHKMLTEREAAQKARDYEASDCIRDELEYPPC